ncbi:MAG: hypothetical protein FJ303_19465 [Planctomycetes bacterium]|nr:hypothetical protein [Planctomycetota bacterium]
MSKRESAERTESVDNASLQRLLEWVERGTFSPSQPGDMGPAWNEARQRGFVVAFKSEDDDDDCALTDAGREALDWIRNPPDSWAWPYMPLDLRSTMRCHNAKARAPLTPGWNLDNYKMKLKWLTALPRTGEAFGVIIHDANANQERFGVGYRYYVPTPDDLAIVQELYPNGFPGNPSWTQIETDLIDAGHEKKDLRQHHAGTLIRLLKKAKQAEPQADQTRAKAVASEGEVKEEAPTDRQCLILETMLQEQITSERRRQTQTAIVRKINSKHKAASYGRDFSKLVKLGFLKSLEGPDGGTWIDPKRKAEVEEIVKAD